MCQSHSFYFYIQLKTSTGVLLRARRPYFGEIWGWPLYSCANLCVLEHQQETRHTPTCNQAWPAFLCKDSDCSKGNSTQGHLESPFAVRTRRGGTSLAWEPWVVGSGCGECRSCNLISFLDSPLTLCTVTSASLPDHKQGRYTRVRDLKSQ